MNEEKRRRQITLRFLILLAVLAAALWGLWFYLQRTSTGYLDTSGASEAVSSAAGSSMATSVSGSSENTLSLSETDTEPAPDAVAQEPDPAPLSSAPWNLILVSEAHPFTRDFPEPETVEIEDDNRVDVRIVDEVLHMLEDARAAGVDPYIVSSFRTWEYQEELFQELVTKFQTERNLTPEEADAEAALWVARPGTSEHQIGLALDIVDSSYAELEADQADTPAQQWLMEHCWEYGFILRYPLDKTELTGIGYEPWHYRYVGVEAAKAITEQGICLEEYLEIISGAQGADGVEDTEDHNADVSEDSEPHISDSGSSKDEAGELNS